jgi:hypothetical protein
MADLRTEHADGMVKKDVDGREIVKIVAEKTKGNESGFRYVHKDTMTDEDKLFVESAPAAPAEVKQEKVAKSDAKMNEAQPGWNKP